MGIFFSTSHMMKNLIPGFTSVRTRKAPPPIPSPRQSPRWRRQSSPDCLSPRSSNNPEDILRKKLKVEEGLLHAEMLRMLASRLNSNECIALQQKIRERTSLVSAMRNTLGVHENVVLTEGYIKLRHSSSEEFTKYWCVIEYPMLKIFEKEKVCYY